MKNFIPSLSRSLYLLALVTLISCSKEEQLVEQIGSLQIQVDANTLAPNGRLTDDATPVALLISIDGPKKLVMERIDLVDFGGEYLSKPIPLPVGNYNLTEFLVIDNNNEVIFATPKAGSTFAPLVSIPLPFNFYVAKDYVSQMSPQVLPADLEKPADFGYSTFTFLIKDYFLLSTLGLTEEGAQFIDPKIYLTHKTDTLFSSTVWQRNMMIPYPASSDSIKLTLLKHGYERYDQVFTTDSLKYYKESPLTIALDAAFTIEFYKGSSINSFNIAVESPSAFELNNGIEKIKSSNQIGVFTAPTPNTSTYFVSVKGDLDKIKTIWNGYQNMHDVDFSQLSNLEDLTMWGLTGKKLDLSSNTKLEYINVVVVAEVIDLSNISNLIELNVGYNDVLSEIIFPHKESLEILGYHNCPNVPLPDFNEYPSLKTITISANSWPSVPLSPDQIDALFASLYSSLVANPRFSGYVAIDGSNEPTEVGKNYAEQIRDEYLWDVHY